MALPKVAFDNLADYIRRVCTLQDNDITEEAHLGYSNVQRRQRLAFPHLSATECLGTSPGITKCTEDHWWVLSSAPSLDLPFRARLTLKSSPKVTLRLRGLTTLLGESGSALSSGT